MKVYKSKVSLGLVIPIFIIVGGLTVLFMIKQYWVGFTTLLCAGAFITHLFLSTRYTIAGDELNIKSGFLVNKAINIASIKKIVGTNSIISSPALSFDRIEVFYNRYDSVILSPKDKEDFINRLKVINILIELR